MKLFKLSFVSLLILYVLVIGYGCKQIQSITQTLVNLQRLQFKLENATDFKLASIPLSNKKGISDFSITDGLNLANAFKNKKFPTEFILNVAAKNPNDGKAGTQSTTATLTSFDWKLYIDGTETINGNINKPIEIPGTGQSTIIPLTMGLDLYEFFGNKGYENVINLALAIGGVSGSTSKLKLDARPSVTTPIGRIDYPGRITIVDTQFSN